MTNDRPIEDPKLQQALNEIKEVFARYGFAGAAMVIGEQEAAFHYAMWAPWSALRHDDTAPLGFRLRAKSAEDGKEVLRRVEGAMHTIRQLSDFGEQTTARMEDMKHVVWRQAATALGQDVMPTKPIKGVTRTVDDVLRDYRAIFEGRPRYEGQPPRDDELLVAEIDRLRGMVQRLIFDPDGTLADGEKS